MDKDNILWAPIIPLIGGFPLGAELTAKTPPKFVSSLNGFNKNDSQYMNYQNNTLGRNIEYRVLDDCDMDFKEKLDFVVCTPPCAALSQLNRGTSADVKGADCAKNDYMYIVAEQGIKCYNADAIAIENAPALFTEKGKGVADKLTDIALTNDYSISFYKTSTHYHGIPQSRDRTFAILWNTKTAPIMNFINKPRKSFEEYLLDVPKSASQNDIIINKNIANEPYYEFIKWYTGNQNARQEIIKSGKKSSLQWVLVNDLLDKAIAWFYDTDNKKGIKYSTHAKHKFSIGKGVWDGSVHVADDYTNAWIGRNMNDTIHPIEDRSCTIRESLHMMAFPHNFELVGGLKNVNMIAQNVPVCTASDIVTEIVEALSGNRMFSDYKILKQNNHNKTTVGLTVKEETLTLGV